MKLTLYHYRFELFLISQLAILFGSLVVPELFFKDIISPILFLSNLLLGILLISKKRKQMWFFIALFFISFILHSLDDTLKNTDYTFSYIKSAIYFLFYSMVTIEIIKQVWNAEFVNKNVIIGLMSGYISLGLIAFFIFTSIELSNANSFDYILYENVGLNGKIDMLLYYSYITLFTIGYGDIIPITPIAQKASVLIGLIGQFYLVIVTAVVIEKYIRHNQRN
jgi:Ion channel